MSTVLVVNEICKRKGLKAKVWQDHDGKVHIYDCMHWTADCAYMLRFLLPNAMLTVEHSVSSLSGFVMVVHSEPEHKAKSSRKRLFLAILITLAIYLLLAFLHLNYGSSDCLLWSPFDKFFG